MLTLVTCIRDEGPFILEWLAHHRALGVTDFLIYSNDCTDGSDALLDALAANGILTHIPRGEMRRGQSPQWTALKSAWDHPLVTQAEWVLVSDVDEFVDTTADTLTDLIESRPDGVEGFVLPWRLFGYSGHVDYQDKDVTSLFRHRAPDGYIGTMGGTFVKSLFLRTRKLSKLGVHRPRQKKDTIVHWLDGSGEPMPDRYNASDEHISTFAMVNSGPTRAWINHYSVRSVESFLVKAARGLPSSRKKHVDLSYWVERNFNHVRDETILRRAEALAAARAELDALPGVTDAHEACVAAHRQKISDLLRDKSQYEFYRAMIIAGSSSGASVPNRRRILRQWHHVKKD